MKHLFAIRTNQTINIIPRVYATSLTLTLRDDSTNEVQTILVNGVKNGNYIQIAAIFIIFEGRFYDLKVYNTQGDIDDKNIIYRDKIFCTSQSTNQAKNNYYSINKDEYIEESANNDFIIL